MECLDFVNLNSKVGIYSIFTETGSTYELEIVHNKTVRLKRKPRADNLNALRRDEQAINIIGPFYVEVGKGAVFTLEPLGKGDGTIRQTSIVKSIVFHEHHNSKMLH